MLLALMVVSLLPLTNRLDGSAACAGSHEIAVTAFLCPEHHMPDSKPSLMLLSNAGIGPNAQDHPGHSSMTAALSHCHTFAFVR